MKINDMSFDFLNKINKGLSACEHYDCYVDVADLTESVISSGIEWFEGEEVPYHKNDVRRYIEALPRSKRVKLLVAAIDTKMSEETK